ncbi:hypothetical protein MPER_06575, partial [Moniliophthora perniciosa FA553]
DFFERRPLTEHPIRYLTVLVKAPELKKGIKDRRAKNATPAAG